MNTFMNDDRLTELLTAAADLRPSSELHRRVTAEVPEHASSRGAVRLGLALSGALGMAAVLTVALLPRESSAEELLRAAAENQARSSGRFRDEVFFRGKWQTSRSGIVAPGWVRLNFGEGDLSLQTPDASFVSSPGGRVIYRVPKREPEGDHYLQLASYLRYLEDKGFDPVVTKAKARVEGGRKLQDVTVDLTDMDERQTFTIDVDADLPVIMRSWRQTRGRSVHTRTIFTFPGPPPGAPEFWAGIDRRRIVDTAELTWHWERKLTPVLRRLPLKDGDALAVRDLRELPNGDVLLLYTGPVDLKARLMGKDGSHFVRVPFSPNGADERSGSRPRLRWGGELLRGMWFTPEKARTPQKGESGDVRLEILGEAGTARGTFSLDPVQEHAAVPEWAVALDSAKLAYFAEEVRLNAKIGAAYDGWIDADGCRVPGTYQLAPTENGWGSEVPPRPGLRRDPAAAAAAAAATRRFLTYARVEGRNINTAPYENWLERFERESRGGDLR